LPDARAGAAEQRRQLDPDESTNVANENRSIQQLPKQGFVRFAKDHAQAGHADAKAAVAHRKAAFAPVFVPRLERPAKSGWDRKMNISFFIGHEADPGFANIRRPIITVM
jgi:hypothetical protein